MENNATIQHGVMPEIAQRWSPLAFSERPVPREVILRMLEAAQWAPSSYNEQPWRFMLGIKGEGETWQRILETCSEWNQGWARHAPVLMLMSAKRHFTLKELPNRAFMYDLGAASAYMTLQLTQEGLVAHQMVGFSPEKARETFQIPDEFEPLVVHAIGYYGSHEELPDALKKRELTPRVRKPLSEWVHENTWDEAAGITQL